MHITIKRLTPINECNNCKHDFDSKLKDGLFFSTHEKVYPKEIDGDDQNGSKNYKFDVVAYRNETPSLIVKVCATNPVSEEKANDIPLFLVELKAEGLIQDPYTWKPTQKRLKASVTYFAIDKLKSVNESTSYWGIDRCFPK